MTKESRESKERVSKERMLSLLKMYESMVPTEGITRELVDETNAIRTVIERSDVTERVIENSKGESEPSEVRTLNADQKTPNQQG